MGGDFILSVFEFFQFFVEEDLIFTSRKNSNELFNN